MTKKTILQWLSIFLERQMLVYQAMSELRPDLIVLANKFDKERFTKAFKLSEKLFHVPSMGTWEKQGEGIWEYFIHGLGCRLINIHIKEPIEWNAPDTNTFHDEWFMNWVKWNIQYTQQYPKTTEQALAEIFKALLSDGSIQKVDTTSGPIFRITH